MKKIKIRATDWFLLGLAGFLDFVEEVNDPLSFNGKLLPEVLWVCPGTFYKKPLFENGLEKHK